MGDVILGVDFQGRRASELYQLEAASEAYLMIPNDLNFDRLLNCINRMKTPTVRTPGEYPWMN